MFANGFVGLSESPERYHETCEKCCDAGRANIELCCYKEWHRDVRYHAISSKHTNDMMIAVQAAKQGVFVEKDTVSRLMLADDAVGVTKTPERPQKQRRHYSTLVHWNMESDGEHKTCTEIVCNEDEENPLTLNRRWGIY